MKSPYAYKSGAEIPLRDSKNAGTADCQRKIVPKNEQDRSKPLKNPPSRGGCTADYIMLSWCVGAENMGQRLSPSLRTPHSPGFSGRYREHFNLKASDRSGYTGGGRDRLPFFLIKGRIRESWRWGRCKKSRQAVLTQLLSSIHCSEKWTSLRKK